MGNKTEEIKEGYKGLVRFMIPIKGDIDFHKHISKGISNSKLERIAMDVGFCVFKYLSIGSIAYLLYRMTDKAYTWQAGADILKGV